MYHQVATRLVLLGDGAVAISQPVSMAGANAARFDATIHSIADPGVDPDQVTVKLQGSSDEQNWADLSVSLVCEGAGHFESDLEVRVPTAWVRLHYRLSTATSGENAVLSGGVYTTGD